MQFQVPQFIEAEDKIVGPLSLRQFIYISVGFGISALLYFMLQTWLWLILSVIILGVTAGVSFVKVGGRPLAKVILSAFHFYWNPQIYVWQPEHPVVTPKRHAAAHEEAPPPVAPLRAKAASGEILHRHWAGLQTGTKVSDNQFAAAKTYRYEVFRKLTGEREAARRVDYR